MSRTTRILSVGLGLFLSSTVSAEFPTEPLPPLPESISCSVDVYPQIEKHQIAPTFLGSNLHPRTTTYDIMTHPDVLENVRSMGMKTLRFPNGCVADLYNWINPRSGWLTVDQFMQYCELVGAEPYYTLNMQGGTEGLEHPIPEGASLEEIIRYKHLAPNPCGYTDYHYGTLAEAIQLLETYTIQRALQGEKPLTRYELGNENWGQWNTDWTPAIYGKTCEVFTSAMRQRLDEAKAQHPELADVELYFVMVGFPSMGNNMDPFAAQDRQANLDWTAEVNRLGNMGLIDAVQEHFYPYATNNGDALYWVIHNLHNILHVRQGVPNDRLGGYKDEELDYDLPLEITEWNLKCWGAQARRDLTVANKEFEDGMNGWTAQVEPQGQGAVSISSDAARRGSSGVELSTQPDGNWAEIKQVVSVDHLMPGTDLFGFGLWIKSATPTDVHIRMKQVNAGEHEGQVMGYVVATQTNMWERMVITGAPFDDTTSIELSVRLEAADARAYVDGVMGLFWPQQSGAAPLAVDTFEQDLYTADALRELLNFHIPRTHWHHLFGNYGCPTMDSGGNVKHQSRAFQLLADRLGDIAVRADCNAPTFQYNTYNDPWSSNFNALAPDMTDIPSLSTVATKDAENIYVFMINRTSDRPIQAQINLAKTTVSGTAEVRTLSGTDIDLAESQVTTSSIPAANPLVHTVAPYTGQVVTIPLDNVTDAPLEVSTTQIGRTGFVGQPLSDGTFTVASGGTDTLQYTVTDDADWLEVTPATGSVGSQPQSLTISYSPQDLRPGLYNAAITVSSEQAYNSPQTISVELNIQTAAADLDRDGDVDMSDFGRMQNCLSGPYNNQSDPACQAAKLDTDDDVDDKDVDALKDCLSGTSVSPDPACAG